MKWIFALVLALAVNMEVGASTSLKVATYNIKGLPFPIQLKHISRYKKMVNAFRKMNLEGNGPDLILLQEAFSKKTGYIYEHLKDIYPYRVRGPAGKIRINAGLEILSRFPIIKSETVLYTSCDSFDCLSRKGALFARIIVPGMGEIDVYDTHMQANNPGRKKVSMRVRNHQTETFIKFVRGTHDDGLPLFMAGDWNARYVEASFQRILQEFGDVNTRDYCESSNACPNYGAMEKKYWEDRIDHIFYQAGSKSNVLPLDLQSFFHVEEYSDHDMLMGSYEGK